MDVVTQMTLLGGAASRSQIVGLCGKRQVESALADRTLLRDARGRYSLPGAHRGIRVANSVAGYLSHRSAAAYWGWQQKDERNLPEVTVPRNRRVSWRQRKVFIPHWTDLHDGEVVGRVTTKRRTLVDCFRNLPYPEALAIGDSAIRCGDVTAEELEAIAESTKGCGHRRIICVAEDSTQDAANAFESVLRSIANLVPGLHVRAQMPLEVEKNRVLHPDIGDAGRRIVAEAESFEFHGDREALSNDCLRYNLFTVLGWVILRFTWRQVMLNPAYVHQMFVDVAQMTSRRSFEHADVALAA